MPKDYPTKPSCLNQLAILAIMLVYSLLVGCVSSSNKQHAESLSWVGTPEESRSNPWLEQVPGVYEISGQGRALLQGCFDHHPEVDDFVRRNGWPSHILCTGFGQPFWLVYRSRKVGVLWDNGQPVMQTFGELKEQYSKIRSGQSIDFSCPLAENKGQNSDEIEASRLLMQVSRSTDERLSERVRQLECAIWAIHAGFSTRIRSAESQEVHLADTINLMGLVLARTEMLLNWENESVDGESSSREHLSTLVWYRVSIPQYLRGLEKVQDEMAKIQSRVSLERTLRGASQSVRLHNTLVSNLASKYGDILKKSKESM